MLDQSRCRRRCKRLERVVTDASSIRLCATAVSQVLKKGGERGLKKSGIVCCMMASSSTDTKTYCAELVV